MAQLASLPSQLQPDQLASWSSPGRMARAYEQLTPSQQANVPSKLLVDLLRLSLEQRESRGSERTWKACSRLLSLCDKRHITVNANMLKEAVSVGLEWHRKFLRAKAGKTLDKAPSHFKFNQIVDLARQHLQHQRTRPHTLRVPFYDPLDAQLRQDLLWCLLMNPTTSATVSGVTLFKNLRVLLISTGPHAAAQHRLKYFIEPTILKLSRKGSSRRNALRLWQMLHHLRNNGLGDAVGLRALRQCAQLLSRFANEQNPKPCQEQQQDLPLQHLRSLPSWQSVLDQLLSKPSEGSSNDLQLAFALTLLCEGFRSSAIYPPLHSLLSSSPIFPPQESLSRLATSLTVTSHGKFRELTPQRKLGLSALLSIAKQFGHFEVVKHIYLIFRNKIARRDDQWRSYLLLFHSTEKESAREDLRLWLLEAALTADPPDKDTSFLLQLWQDLQRDSNPVHIHAHLSAAFWSNVGASRLSYRLEDLLKAQTRPFSSADAAAFLQASITSRRLPLTVSHLRLILRHDPSIQLQLKHVWNPLLHSIAARRDSDRGQLFKDVFRRLKLANEVDESSILALMRLHSRKYPFTSQGMATLQQIRRNMVADFSVKPDDRHQAELVHGLLRSDRLPEALTLFMDCEHPSLFSDSIVAFLIVKLADRDMYEEAHRANAKWASEKRPTPALAEFLRVQKRESSVLLASLYAATKQAGMSQLDSTTLARMGLDRSNRQAIENYNRKLVDTVNKSTSS